MNSDDGALTQDQQAAVAQQPLSPLMKALTVHVGPAHLQVDIFAHPSYETSRRGAIVTGLGEDAVPQASVAPKCCLAERSRLASNGRISITFLLEDQSGAWSVDLDRHAERKQFRLKTLSIQGKNMTGRWNHVCVSVCVCVWNPLTEVGH